MTRCPKCSGRAAEILYGYVIMDDELRKAIDGGDLILGGCSVSERSPGHECRSCHHRW